MPRGKASYAGIEINFSANYTDLVESLQRIDRESKKIEKSLSATQNALKFDPENTELAAVQQKVLADAIGKTEERLKLLKSTEAEVKAEFEKGDIPTEQYAKYLSEIAKTEKALREFKGAQAESAVSADQLAGEILILKQQLIDYSKAAEQAAKSGDESKTFGIDQKIQETSNRIEEYKQKISALLNSESGLKSEQDKLKASTDSLSEAQRNAAGSAAQMGDGFTVARGVISDLASSVIKKTANALIDFTKGSLEAASSLYEVENVVDVSFGSMRNKVDEFSDTAIEYYGISELTAKRTASLFAAMGEGMDLALDKATNMAIGLAKRSADMASFYDISQEITSTALKSVFTGETESLKRFGVVMTEANLQQYALAQGIEKTVKEMSQAEKVQLRYNYLMDATASSEGDFARTSDSFANKTRQLKERLTETSVAIGERFITNLDGAFNTLDKLLEKVNEAAENGDLDDFIKDVSDILKNLLNVLTQVGGVLVKFPKLTATTAAGFMALKAAGRIKQPFEQAAAAVGKLAFNMSDATEQTGLLSSKLLMSAGGWATAATAAISVAMAIADYVDGLDEALKSQQPWNEEQMEAIKAAQELTQTYKGNAESRRESIAGIEAEYGVYREQAKRLTELANKTEKTNEDLAEMVGLTEQLNSGMQGLGLEFNKATGEINLQGEELQRLIGSYEDLAKAEAAKSALTDIYEEQYKATAKVNANVKKRFELTQKLNEAEVRLHEAEKQYEIMFENTDVYDPEEVQVYADNLTKAKSEVDGLSNAIAVLYTEYVEYSELLELTNEELAEMNELYERASEGKKDAAEKLAAATEELKEQAQALDELNKAYSDLTSAIGSYKSDISDLIKIQNDLAEGTEMSTLEMLDMIEKYPELIGQIKKTENGYTLEKQALEELIKVRLTNLKLAAREKQQTAEDIFLQKGGSKGQLEGLKGLIDSGKLKNLSQFDAQGYTDGLYEALEGYAYSKGIDSLMSDIMNEGIKEGAKATEEAEKAAEKQSTRSGKATIAEAEAIITALEHKYKQGIISAETYYSDLDRIANEYYGKQGGYLERYMELEDEAQAGLKKAIEDRAKSYQDLESRIEGVIDAQKELKGIESNKNVLAYDEARGFKLEADQAAIANASKNLADAQRQLMLSLAEMSGNSGIYGAFADRLAESTSEALKQILPDLTGAYNDAAAYSEEMAATTQNYTFNFGDIKTSGDAAEFRKMLNDFVNAVINETQLI